jgi:hypothetical protein
MSAFISPVQIWHCIPSSFFSSAASSAAAAPPAAAPPAAGAAPPAPPEGTEASLLEPSAINYPELVCEPPDTCIDSAYLLEVLAVELGDQGGETLIIGFDSDRVEDLLDVLLGGRGVATDGEEEVSCEVLHFDC